MSRFPLTKDQEEELSQLFLKQSFRKKIIPTGTRTQNNIQRLFIVLEGKNQFNDDVFCVMGIDSFGNISLFGTGLHHQMDFAAPLTKKDGLKLYEQIMDIVRGE